jgi:hypothetical protein
MAEAIGNVEPGGRQGGLRGRVRMVNAAPALRFREDYRRHKKTGPARWNETSSDPGGLLEPFCGEQIGPSIAHNNA